MSNLRVVKLNINQLPDVIGVKSLEYLLEVQARENVITNIEFMTGSAADL